MLHQWKHTALVAFIDQSDWIKLFEIRFLPEVIKIVCFFLIWRDREEKTLQSSPPFPIGQEEIASDLNRKKIVLMLPMKSEQDYF